MSCRPIDNSFGESLLPKHACQDRELSDEIEKQASANRKEGGRATQQTS
jgi:hypothetical protein